jgi:hypothetical protein
MLRLVVTGGVKCNGEKTSKFLYLALMFLSTLLAAVLRYNGHDIIGNLGDINGDSGCDDVVGDNNSCQGNQAVYRVSFAMSVFFLIMAGLTASIPKAHTECWFAKIFGYAGFLFATFFMPNDVFDVYLPIARVLSAFFLLLQIVILIDFCFDLHEYLVDKMAESDASGDGSQLWKAAYVVVTFLGCAGSITGCALMYEYYGFCPANNTFISITLIFGFFLTVLSGTEKVNKGLLTPAGVWSYCTYLCWSAVNSNPNAECNPSSDDNFDTSQRVLLWLGICISSFALMWTSFRTSSAAPNLFKLDPPPLTPFRSFLSPPPPHSCLLPFLSSLLPSYLIFSTFPVLPGGC